MTATVVTILRYRRAAVSPLGTSIVLDTLVTLASATGDGFPRFLVTPIIVGLGLALVVWLFVARTRKAHQAAVSEPGVVLSLMMLSTNPTAKQVEALTPTYGVAGQRAPKAGFTRPVIAIDEDGLRLTLKGSSDSTYLSIPRAAITGAEIVDFRDRAMKARSIRIAVTAGDATYPLDLVVVNPKNSTTFVPQYVDEVFPQLRAALGLGEPAPL